MVALIYIYVKIVTQGQKKKTCRGIKFNYAIIKVAIYKIKYYDNNEIPFYG